MRFSFISYDIKITSILFLTLLFYYLFYYFTESKFLKKTKKEKKNPVKSEVQLFLLIKITGFMVLGIIPGIIYYLAFGSFLHKFGFTLSAVRDNLLLVAILTATTALFIYAYQKSNPTNSSLQMNIQEWSVLLFMLNALGWMVYLAGYEFLFRGILLFECYEHFGFWPSVAVNVMLYSAIHMVYGKKQAIGALFFGTLACYLTLRCGTIYIPFFIHLALSLFSDYFSIRINPHLKFSSQPKIKISRL